MRHKPDIDAALAVLEIITPPGHTWSQREIAEICGVSHTYIYAIEKKAIAKLAANTAMQRIHQEAYQ